MQKLERLLKSLFDQSYPLYEIVVVNDGPHPDIREYLRRQSNDIRLTVLEFDANTKTTPGKKAPLAAGIRAAKYDWILLTDADCVPGPEWISEMMDHATPGIEMVLGVAPFFARPGFLNLLQRFDTLLIAIQYIGATLRGTPFMGVGRNLLYHRSLFEMMKGFSSHAHLLSGDDDLFVQSAANRNNTSVCMHPSAFVFSEAPATWTAWMHQKRRHLSASSAYSVIAKLQTSVFVVSWLLVWIGLPFVLSSGNFWFNAGIAGVMLLWLLFAFAAHQLLYRQLIPWYPFMAVSYCVMLCTFAFILTLRPPKSWMRS